MSKAAPCKHPQLDKTLRCKSCGAKVDIREKRNKYGNRHTDGFASAKEARRYEKLKSLSVGVMPYVMNLEIQPEWDLIVDGVLICKYRADFRFRLFDGYEWSTVVEDVKPRGKGFKKTAAYRLFEIKKRLMRACHGIEVVEV